MSVASTSRRLLSSSSRVISQAATALPSSSSSSEPYIPPPPHASTSSSRRHVVRQKLAKVEATRGGLVSPFLTDSFGREHDYLRISLTEKCNLRCTYCMPENGAPLSPKEHLLTSDEIVRLAGLFVKNGVRKIRLTGGEPTVRRDLAEIVERLSALGIDSLGMTSNGLALARKLPGLVDAGLTSLNISLDTLDEHKFELMTRRRGHSAVLNAIKQASSLHHTSSSSSLSTGRRLKNLKLNVVVINGLNDAEVPAFVELTQDLPLSVRFIEYMPFSDNRWSTSKLVPSADLLAQISAQHPIGSIHAITPGISDTAREYRVEGYKGSFGFISSMTDHFCSGCSRLRIQADGGMKVCLFGAPKVSLRDLMRSGQSDAEIAQSIGIAVKNKHFAHDGSSAGWEDLITPMASLLPFTLPVAKEAKTAPYPSAKPLAKASPRRYRSAALPFMLASTTNTMYGYPPLSQIRLYSTSRPNPPSEIANEEPRLTHISSETGKPTMVSITDKSSTSRSAIATGRVLLTEQLYNMLSASSETGEKNLARKKGDVLLVAQLAGIMGSKKTSDLIPLCHPLNLSNVQVGLELKKRQEDGRNLCFVEVSCTAECQGSTGVEMEALTGVSVACLTIWDMCKAVAGKEMVIEDIKVLRKSGGKSGDWERSA